MRGALALAIVLACASIAHGKPGIIQYESKAMGTNVHLWLWTDRQVEAAKVAQAVDAEMKRLDAEMTIWTPDSEISKVIAAAGVKPVKVSDETIEVVSRAQDVSKRSNGVFDITVGAFQGVWKFDQNMDGTLPDPRLVAERLKLVNYKDLIVDPVKKTLFLRKKGMAITLGGIAKGYAVDKCVAIIKAAGFTNFMFQAGGDMYIAGTKSGVNWKVGIRDPRGKPGEYFALAPIMDHSFSTSGDYERGFVKDGKRWHHIIDPRTGMPATASRSVTIRAKDAFTADAWSKVMFIYGWQQGTEIIAREKLEDFDAAWVDDKNEVHVTPALQQDLVMLKKPTPGI